MKPNTINILKIVHQKYVDWWSPIDISAGSVLAPMSFNRFCDSLLTFNDAWWDRWIGESISADKKQPFKVDLLKLCKNNI